MKGREGRQGGQGRQGMEGPSQAAVASSESPFGGSTCIGATSSCWYAHAVYLDNDLLDSVGTRACLYQVQVLERRCIEVQYIDFLDRMASTPSAQAWIHHGAGSARRTTIINDLKTLFSLGTSAEVQRMKVHTSASETTVGTAR